MVLTNVVSAAQPRVAIPRNHPVAVTGLTRRATPDKTLHLRVVFAVRDATGLNRFLEDVRNPRSPYFQQWLKPEQYDDRFAQPQPRIDAVEEWLAHQGFHVTRVDRHEIEAAATVKQVEQAFSVVEMTVPGGEFYANEHDPQVPAQFADVIESIDGLENVHAFRAGAGAPLQSANTAFKPADFQTFYDETPLLMAGDDGGSPAYSVVPGHKPPIVAECGVALVETTDYLDSAVDTFNSTYGLPKASLTKVFTNGANPGIPEPGADNEALMDIEWVHAVVPGADIRVYIGDLDSAIAKPIEEGVCGAISISYILCGYPNAHYQSLDALFARAVSQGQSVFVSSGDFGAAAPIAGGGTCVAGSVRGVSEMAASPHVTAVGGTQFSPTYDNKGNDIGSVSESAWNGGPNGGATGGGRSSVFTKPSFQAGVTPPDAARDLPDVALGASNKLPGFYTVLNYGGHPGTPIALGGTSLATPMWAGIARLISRKARPPNANHNTPNPRLGTPNPEIYKLATSASGLRDVSSGDNSYNGVMGYSAVSGFNLATGWGTPDISAFVSAYVHDLCSTSPWCSPDAANKPVN